jgi:hypothetical protein
MSQLLPQEIALPGTHEWGKEDHDLLGSVFVTMPIVLAKPIKVPEVTDPKTT